MDTGTDEIFMGRDEAIKKLAAGVIAEYGADAEGVARRQIANVAGDIQVTWTAILAFIEERGRPEIP